MILVFAVWSQYAQYSSELKFSLALYLSFCILSLTTKLKGNPFEFQAQFRTNLRPKSNWRIGQAIPAVKYRSYWSL